MDRGLYLAASGMLAEQVRQDQIANDLANASTAGYKADRTTQQSFGEMLLTNSVTGQPIGPVDHRRRRSPTRVTDWTPQPLKDTGEPLDFAINGDGFFAVQTADGTRYTRNGQFSADAQGRLTTLEGDPVLGRNGQPVTLGADGKVDPRLLNVVPAAQPGEGRRQPRHRHAGRRRRPDRRPGPLRRARGLRRRPDQAMVDMIASMRAYESGQKVIQTIDETLGKAASSVGSLTCSSLAPPSRRSIETMLEGLRTAAAGMAAQQQKLDAVANDLANAEHHRLQARPRRLLGPALRAGRPAQRRRRRSSAPASRAVQAGRSFEQGGPAARPATRSTSRIQGDGFIKVKLSDGREALTRDGDLHLDGTRPPRHQLPAASSSPRSRSPTASPRTRSRSAPTAPCGRRPRRRQDRARQRALAAEPRVGRRQRLRRPPPRSGNAVAAPAATVLTQGALEASNTDMAQAMTDMIDAQRTYQLTSKAIQTADSDDGDRQRGQAMSVDPPDLDRLAARRRARRRHRGHQELQGRARLRADARRPARQGDGPRRELRSAEGPYASTMQDTLTTALDRRSGAGPRPAALQGDAVVVSTVLEAELLVHLDTQINSARHLLKLVLAQGAAIRERDTEAVLARLADIQTEMVRRGTLEQERTSAAPARRRRPRRPRHHRHARAPLRARHPRRRHAPRWSAPPSCAACSSEIAREHGINRALMRQELTFLSHLTRLIGQEPEPGYSPPERRHAAAPPRAVRLPRSGPPGLTPPDSDAHLLLLRHADLAARPYGPAAHARHHRPQHRERLDQGLLAPGGHAGRLAGAAAPGPGAATSTGAHLGSGVDVQGFRRVRDQFLDSQYRAPEHEPQRVDRQGRRRSTAPSSRSPSRATTASTRSSTKFWNVLVGPLQGTRRPRRQAGARPAGQRR